MKVLRTLATAVGALVLATTAAIAAPPEFYRDMISPVFSLGNQNCTASVIKSDKGEDGKVRTELLTAEHCIGTLSRDRFLDYDVFDDDFNKIEARKLYYDVVKRNKSYDLATIVLRNTDIEFPVVKIADEITAELGDPTWVVGYPLGGTKTMTSGLYGGLQSFPILGVDSREIYLRSSAQISPGNSGGPLFQRVCDTAKDIQDRVHIFHGCEYQVIGVASKGIPSMAHMGLYVPLKKIRIITGMESGHTQYIHIPYFFEGP